MTFLVITNNRILSGHDTLREAEEAVLTLAKGPTDFGDVHIAELVITYKRKVTYDKIPEQ